MSPSRRRQERRLLRFENELLQAEISDLRDRLSREVMKALDLAEQCIGLRAELDQAEAELRALRGEVA
jgi:uncharacterized tellurite resistance protein B-like protein